MRTTLAAPCPASTPPHQVTLFPPPPSTSRANVPPGPLLPAAPPPPGGGPLLLFSEVRATTSPVVRDARTCAKRETAREVGAKMETTTLALLLAAAVRRSRESSRARARLRVASRPGRRGQSARGDRGLFLSVLPRDRHRSFGCFLAKSAPVNGDAAILNDAFKLGGAEPPKPIELKLLKRGSSLIVSRLTNHSDRYLGTFRWTSRSEASILNRPIGDVDSLVQNAYDS